MSINKLSGRISQEYHQDEVLTATEFNKIPSKVNEIIDTVNNLSSIDEETLSDLGHISERITENSQNISANTQSINDINSDITDIRNSAFKLEGNISSQTINNIDQYSEIKLGIDAFGKLCLIKTNDMSVNININPSSFEIDSVLQNPIQIEISVTSQDPVTSINVTSDNGTVVMKNDIYHWELSDIVSTTNLTVVVNNKNPRIVIIPFDIKRSALLWSTEVLPISAFQRRPNMTSKGFYLPNSTQKFDSTQDYWYGNHPDRTTPMYLYIVTTTQIPQDQLRTKFFLYGSSISGGMDYVGEVMQYSNTIPYYVYKTNDKIDTSITVEIR